MIAAGRRPPFIQVGMVLAPGPGHAEQWRVRDIYEEESAPDRSVADLVTRGGSRRTIGCVELREQWVLAEPFEECRRHSGDWPRRGARVRAFRVRS